MNSSCHESMPIVCHQSGRQNCTKHVFNEAHGAATVIGVPLNLESASNRVRGQRGSACGCKQPLPVAARHAR